MIALAAIGTHIQFDDVIPAVLTFGLLGIPLVLMILLAAAIAIAGEGLKS
jgi:hypothetical protein